MLCRFYAVVGTHTHVDYTHRQRCHYCNDKYVDHKFNRSSDVKSTDAVSYYIIVCVFTYVRALRAVIFSISRLRAQSTGCLL